MTWWRRLWRLAGATVAVAVASQAGFGATPAAVASYYAGEPVTVTCRPLPGLLGVADGASVELDRARVCAPLARPARTARFVEAVLTVVHEGTHVRHPAAGEWWVECQAARATTDALARFYGVRRAWLWAPLVRAVTFRPGCA